MNAAPPEPQRLLNCFSCGYDLRGAADRGDDQKCPECGFPIRDTIAGRARIAGRWEWKVRVGLTLLIAALPLLIPSVLITSRALGPRFPVFMLNLPGPKVWGTPVAFFRWSGSAQSVLALLTSAGLIMNVLGVWLASSPDPSATEHPLSLRRWLRVYATAAVVGIWLTLTPSSSPFRLSGGDQYNAIATLLLIELPGTALLYLYLSTLAANTLRDPALSKRAALIFHAAAAIQVVSAFAAMRVAPTDLLQSLPVVAAYFAASLCVGLLAVDVMFDLVHAVGAAARDDARR